MCVCVCAVAKERERFDGLFLCETKHGLGEMNERMIYIGKGEMEMVFQKVLRF